MAADGPPRGLLSLVGYAYQTSSITFDAGLPSETTVSISAAPENSVVTKYKPSRGL